jgi:hypothetical protein
MDKHISTLILFFLITCQLFGQDSSLVKEKFVIEETITTIDKLDLFGGWKNFTSDTINPTSITQDLDGDGKLDIAGFFTGIEHGFFIFGNINGVDGNMEQLYKFPFANSCNLPFDKSWFDQGKFQAVIALVKSGKRIRNIETGSLEKLKYNSVLISKKDGSQFIVTFKDNEWRIIKIK